MKKGTEKWLLKKSDGAGGFLDVTVGDDSEEDPEPEAEKEEEEDEKCPSPKKEFYKYGDLWKEAPKVDTPRIEEPEKIEETKIYYIKISFEKQNFRLKYRLNHLKIS